MHDPLIRNRKGAPRIIITHFSTCTISGHDSYSSLIATRSRICNSCLVSIHDARINGRISIRAVHDRIRLILIKNRERRNPRKPHRQSSRIWIHNFGLLHWIIGFEEFSHAVLKRSVTNFVRQIPAWFLSVTREYVIRLTLLTMESSSYWIVENAFLCHYAYLFIIELAKVTDAHTYMRVLWRKSMHELCAIVVRFRFV